MSELQPTEYTHVNEIDRAHAVAGFINRTIRDEQQVQFRDALQMVADNLFQLDPVQQAENTLARKNAEEQASQR